MTRMPMPPSGFVCPDLSGARKKAAEFPNKVGELLDHLKTMNEKLEGRERCGVLLARETITAAAEVLDFLT